MLGWLKSNVDVIQVVLTIASTALALLTLLVLAITWRAIKRQAEAAEDQAEAARAMTEVALAQTKATIEAAEAAMLQTRLLPAQMEISRKQIHADRLAEIFKTLRKFEHFVVHSGKVAVGKDFSEFGNISQKGGKICDEYLELQEAYYLSRLISEPLFHFMTQRMKEADGLQRVPYPELLQERLREFHKNWDVYELATKLRELS